VYVGKTGMLSRIFGILSGDPRHFIYALMLPARQLHDDADNPASRMRMTHAFKSSSMGVSV